MQSSLHCLVKKPVPSIAITFVSSRTELRLSTQTVSTGPSNTIQNQALQCCKYGGFEREDEADDLVSDRFSLSENEVKVSTYVSMPK